MPLESEAHSQPLGQSALELQALVQMPPGKSPLVTQRPSGHSVAPAHLAPRLDGASVAELHAMETSAPAATKRTVRRKEVGRLSDMEPPVGFSFVQAGGRSQKPARHNRPQHCALWVHASPTGRHTGGAPASAPGVGPGGAGGGASQRPLVQLDVQQSLPVVQVEPAGTQGVVQVFEAESQ